VTSHAEALDINGLFTQESRTGQIAKIGRRDFSDWLNGLRYHNFDTKPDTESKRRNEGSRCELVSRRAVSGRPYLEGALGRDAMRTLRRAKVGWCRLPLTNPR